MPEEEHIAAECSVQNDWKNLLNKFGHVEHTLGSPTISYCYNIERIHKRENYEQALTVMQYKINCHPMWQIMSCQNEIILLPILVTYDLPHVAVINLPNLALIKLTNIGLIKLAKFENNKIPVLEAKNEDSIPQLKIQNVIIKGKVNFIFAKFGSNY